MSVKATNAERKQNEDAWLKARLSMDQLAALKKKPYLKDCFTGTAIEKEVAMKLARSRLFKHAGTAKPGQMVADFIGQGKYHDLHIDVTTEKGSVRKGKYKYGLNTIYVFWRTGLAKNTCNLSPG
jgi:hypothetical protein